MTRPNLHHRSRKFWTQVEIARNNHARIQPQRHSAFWPIVILVLPIAILIGAGGCLPHRLPFDQSTTRPLLPSHVPANLHSVSVSMNVLIFIAVAGFGIGIAAYFIIPGDHKLACGVIFGSGAMGAVALIVQTSLPFLPWIFAAIALLGLVWLALRVLSKKANAGVSP